MRYVMKAGILYRGPDRVLARLKGSFVGPEKRVYQNDGSMALRTSVCVQEHPGMQRADVRSRTYVMLDAEEKEIAVARPGYAEGDDPAVAGWPVCRLPRVDHAAVTIHGRKYLLTMQNSRNYTLRDRAGYIVVQIMHRGSTGGWDMDVDGDLAPEILCGLFAFCRYIEQENEFLVV